MRLHVLSQGLEPCFLTPVRGWTVNNNIMVSDMHSIFVVWLNDLLCEYKSAALQEAWSLMNLLTIDAQTPRHRAAQ